MSERVEHGRPAAGGDDATGTGGHTARLAIAWTIVGVPLAYGISQTLIRASQLFTQ